MLDAKVLRKSMAAMALIGAVAACKDTEEPEPEPEVASMRLSISATGTANQTVTVSNTGVVTPTGGISLKVNTPTTITALFLKADGSTEDIAMTDEFQLNVVQLTPATITMTRTSDFVVVLTGSATTTSGSGKFGLFHKAEQHFDFGEWTVPISVIP